ncbi:MAG: NAD(P)-dependent oxidoreductase [Betaproteobacteria bacterium]|nr:NAD(P)-dependent oxidoreductase [Betaproteobacteria bacterium]
MADYSAVLITGAAGWLGQTVVDAFATGLADVPGCEKPPFPDGKLIATDMRSCQPPEPASFVSADLSQPTECQRVCAQLPPGALIVHCAGLVHPHRHIRELYQANHQVMVNLAAAAGEAGAKRLIAVSSNSPCGCNPTAEHMFDEESPYNPYLSYGRSKMLMEQTLRAQSKTAWTIIRAPWFYGPRQPARQVLFFSMIRGGKGPIVGGGDNRRSMTYLDNLAQAIVKAAGSPAAAGQIYWIADAQPYTMNQIIDTIERLLEEEFALSCARRRLRLPGLASQIAYLADRSLQAVGLYHPKIHVLSEMNKTIACNIDKAREQIGYCPSVDLEEGMRRSIKDALSRGLTI